MCYQVMKLTDFDRKCLVDAEKAFIYHNSKGNIFNIIHSRV